MKVFYSILLLTFTNQGFSQGTIRYTESVKTEIKMDLPPGMEDTPHGKAMLEQINKAAVSQKVLYFDETKCVFQDYEQVEQKPQVIGGGEIEIIVGIIQEKVISYHDLTNHLLTESRDIFDKTFIVTDTAKKVKWKMGTEIDTIAGYRCLKATYTKDTVLVQAWFAPELKVSTGPDNSYGLPGTILKLDIDEGRRVITATSVDLTPPTAELLKAPKKGKKVTRKEYDEILRKKLQEQAELEGGGTKQTIRIEMH